MYAMYANCEMIIESVIYNVNAIAIGSIMEFSLYLID